MKNRLLIMLFFGHVLIASQKPYIPSYDDWYSDDLKQANANKNYFKEPEDDLNYAEYHYIGAHAAEKYPRFFSEYVLQQQPLPGLLSTGVRGLMLNVYDWALNWSSLVRDGRSIVCSRPHLETNTITKSGKKLYQTLHYEMNRIFNFLKTNPQAVITIIFYDPCDINKLQRDLKEIVAKNNYDPIFKPSDWNAEQEKNGWPTLGWMRSNNKRLILFTRLHRHHTVFTWPTESYFWENNYGTTNTTLVCIEGKKSFNSLVKKNQALVWFGCIGGTAINDSRNYRKCFDYDFVKKITNNCQKKGFAKGKIFNGYWADHIIKATSDLVKSKRKTAFDYVNELNVTPPSISRQVGTAAKS